MEKIVICKGDGNSQEMSIKDFNPKTIKEALGDKKDFSSIGLMLNEELEYYLNGIILSFDEVLQIVKKNPKYKEIVSEINKHKALGQTILLIMGYDKYKEKVLFIPNTQEFTLLYNEPKMITDLIPDFVVDTTKLEEIRNNSEKYNDFYLKHIEFLNLFDRLINIFTHTDQVGYANLNFDKYGFDYLQILEFLRCYEAMFKIKKSSLYEHIKSDILEKYNSKFKSNGKTIGDIEYEKSIKLLPEHPEVITEIQKSYITFGINENFTKKELDDALSRIIQSLQNEFRWNREEMRKRIDSILDMYNNLLYINNSRLENQNPEQIVIQEQQKEHLESAEEISMNSQKSMENPYIGKDGKDYYTLEDLNDANRRWAENKFVFIEDKGLKM